MILPISSSRRQTMERTLLEWLRRRLPAEAMQRLPLGLSDDAALLELTAAGACVITTDMLCDGVHFRSDELPLPMIGRKAVAVNLSDLAAMAATPLALFVSLAIPRTWPQRQVEALYEGMIRLADQFESPIAGGDTNRWDGALVLNVVAVGLPPAAGVWRRSGGKPGDWLLVTGALGGSLSERHYTFEPRVREAQQLAAGYTVHAALDLSDGLSLDGSRLAAASGCGIALDLDRVPISAAATTMAAEEVDGRSALERALSDGEDFELLLALPEDEARRLLREQPLAIPLTCVGQLVEQQGMWQRVDGRLDPLEVSGYLHE